MPGYVRAHGSRLVKGGRRGFGVGATPTPPPSGSTIQTFTVKNDGTTSKAFYIVGLDFASGDCPSGSVPVIKRGSTTLSAQFSDRVAWADGSLETCTAIIRDDDWTAPEASRSITVEVASGSFNDTGTLAYGDVGTAGYDPQVTTSGCVYWGNGSTGDWRDPGTSVPSSGTGADGDRFYKTDTDAIYEKQSGTWTLISNDGTRSAANGTSNFATVAASGNTKLWAGPVAECWRTVPGALGTDTDLQCVHYVIALKDSEGAIADVLYAPVMKLTKWKSTTKYMLEYTLAVKDGATTIETWSNVKHPYHSTWAAVVGSDVVYEGKPHTLGGTADHMVYVPDRAYWGEAGTLPPMKWSATMDSAATIGYTERLAPCKPMDHRANIGEGGGYAGRGILTNIDMCAYLNGTAADMRAARVNAYATLHIPEHFTDDTTGTIKPLILLGHGNVSGDYDWTGDGLPASVHAYMHPDTASGDQDSYGTYRGGALLQRGAWKLETGNNTHRVNYAWGVYKIERWPWLLDGMIEIANAVLHTVRGTAFGAKPTELWPRGYTMNASAENFSAIAYVDTYGERDCAWAFWSIGSTAALVPEDRAEHNYLRDLTAHNMKYMSRSITENMTSDWVASGAIKVINAVYSPWMHNFATMTVWQIQRMLPSSDGSTFANHLSKRPVAQWTYKYHSRCYRAQQWNAQGNNSWDASTAPAFTTDNLLYDAETCSIAAATDTITTTVLWNLPWTNGDRIVFTPYRQDDNLATVPSEVTMGNTYYVIDAGTPSGSTQTLKVSTTEGGAAVNFASDYTNVGIAGFKAQADAYSTAQNPPFLPDADSYTPIAWMALVLAHVGGHSGATSTIVNDAETFVSTIDFSQHAAWFAEVPA